MPTHDYIISNGTGAAVRADINLALSAIVSLNSSATEPATMYAYQLWADTALGLLKIRNSANSAWITLRQLDGDFSIVAVEDGLQATPSLTFTNDLNTGIFRPGNDSLAIVTNALRAITITSTQAVGIQTANPSTALHVAGNARVGADDVTDAHLQIGKGATGNRNSYIDIVGDTTYTDYGVRFIRNNTGANATSEIKHRGTGAFNIVAQEAAPIEFYTSNSPRVAIDSSGRLLVGTSNARSSGAVTGRFQLEGVGGSYDSYTAQIYSNSTDTAACPRLYFGRSRGTANGAVTPVQQHDFLGVLAFHGANGTDLSNTGAEIAAIVDGEPFTSSDTTDLPTRLVFSTTSDSASSPTERMRINSAGTITFSAYGAGTLSTSASGVISASDGRYKTKTRQLESGLDAIAALEPTYYRWNEGSPFESEYEELGFVAQEVAAVIPEASPGEDEEGKYRNYHDRAIIAMLVKGMQEQQSIITALTARVAALEAQ